MRRNNTKESVTELLPQIDKTPKVSTTLNRKVICPVCGEEGLLTVRQRKKQWYLYVRHPVKEMGEWRVKEHYVGPARLFYISRGLTDEEWLLREPLVYVKAEIGESCYVTYILTEKAEKELRKLREGGKDRKNAMKQISLIRQIMIDYYAELLWLKELIDREINDIQKRYGIKEEEAVRALKSIKKSYASLILYRKEEF